MNERIKELSMKYAHKMGNSLLYNAEFIEEFAELIVRECAEHCKGEMMDKKLAEEAVILADMLNRQHAFGEHA
jgi:hypothetical protein